jgi:hypothetical protein
MCRISYLLNKNQTYEVQQTPSNRILLVAFYVFGHQIHDKNDLLLRIILEEFGYMHLPY